MAEKQAAALVASGKLDKSKLSEIKGLLKALGQSQSGEKSELNERLLLFVEGAAVCAGVESGSNPASLKIGDLRKELAKRGLPCDTSISTRDELLRSLVDTLKRSTAPTASAGGSATGADEAAGSAVGASKDKDPARDIELAKRVLELAETGEDEAILSLAGLGGISRACTVAAMRKAYLHLSRSIHPDKLGRNFADATKAFQALVGAFERLSQPDVLDDEPRAKNAKGKAASTIARSNANCFKTAMKCPRCKVEWGQACDGVEKYCYNFMMQGVKCFTCSTCLLEFGCMTAVHNCPHCRKDFEYSPADFHRQVTCGNPKCTKEFGFNLFYVPPRVEDDLRAEVKKAAEHRLKVVEGARSRAERAARKAGLSGAGRGGECTATKEEEKAFTRGLVDACPRCGWEPTSKTEAKEENLIEHLKSCTDKKSHAAHLKRKAGESARDEAKAKGRSKQDDAMTEAAFQMMGAQASQMWMLTDAQLDTRCLQLGLRGAGEPAVERTEMLTRLSRHAAAADNSRLLTDGGAGTAPSRRGGKGVQAPSAASLPDNLHSLSLRQLKDVCAAHGFTSKGRSTDAVIKELEARRFSGEDAVLLLE